MAELSRTPPTSVREILRREVNFGCPVEGCGEPYLTWHHFDPPWRVKKHHNPEGMIALCLTHAGQADSGTWIDDQLRRMKREPYLTGEDIQSKFDYLRKDTVCMIGNIAYQVKNVMTIRDERVIGFNIDSDGYNRLNLLIRNRYGTPVLQMDDNFWIAHTSSLHDISCSARGKTLEIVSNDGTKLKMRFDDYKQDVFRNILVNEVGALEAMVDRFIKDIGAPETIPVWALAGTLKWGLATITIRRNELNLRVEIDGVTKTDMTLGASFAGRGGTALAL